MIWKSECPDERSPSTRFRRRSCFLGAVSRCGRHSRICGLEMLERGRNRYTPSVASSRYNACVLGCGDASQCPFCILDLAPNRSRLHRVRPMGTVGTSSIPSRAAVRYCRKESGTLVAPYGFCCTVCNLFLHRAQRVTVVCRFSVGRIDGNRPSRLAAVMRCGEIVQETGSEGGCRSHNSCEAFPRFPFA